VAKYKYMSECDKKKYSGRVEISGKIYLNEYFGLGGNSDADTLRLYITPDSIKFRKYENENWQYSLTLFENAFIYNEVDGKRTKIITRNNSKSQNYLKIRLQGVDAPELHYAGDKGDLFLYPDVFSKYLSLKELFNFRQNWGATSTKELAIYLEQFAVKEGTDKIVNVNAISNINSPSDLFDRYGRAIADIQIPEAKNTLNHWLVEEGWAIADFYDSMSNDEILDLKNASLSASSSNKGILPNYKKELVPFDYNLTLEYGASGFIDTDKGPFNMPKFFRKQVDYEILKKSGYKVKTLKKFIETRKSKCYLVEDFLAQRHCAQEHYLAEFIDENEFMNVEPGSLVNIESGSQIETPHILNNWF
jgi:endonuclease YncB( thermonuclease family)